MWLVYMMEWACVCVCVCVRVCVCVCVAHHTHTIITHHMHTHTYINSVCAMVCDGMYVCVCVCVMVMCMCVRMCFRLVGYDETMCEQPWLVSLMLKITVTVPSLLFFMVGLPFLYHYPITEAVRERMKKLLEDRRCAH